MVSVILVNYYSGKFLKTAIKDILDSKIVKKIIIVDNSNNKNETKILQTLSNKQEKICIMYLKDNVGFAKACNIAYSKCYTKYILLLNPDTLMKQDSLKILVDTLDNRNDVGAVSPQSFWDSEYEFYLPPLVLPSPFWECINTLAFRSFIIRELLHKYMYKKSLNSLKGYMKTNMVSGGHMLIKKEAIEKMGYFFDEEFFMYYEDADLCKRINKSGYKLLLVNDAKIIHFWRDSDKKNKFQEKSKKYYFKKHFKTLWFWERIKNFIEKFPLKEPKHYINIGEIEDMDKINKIIEKHKPYVVEFGFHYTFVPAILYFIKERKKVNFNKIISFLKTGEYWINLKLEKKQFNYFEFLLNNSLKFKIKQR